MTTPCFGRIKNWSSFQHYTKRNPPWIRLYRNLLDNMDFICLPLASKALAPCLWLLASESERGEIRLDIEWLMFRLRSSKQDIIDGLKPLVEKGFIDVHSDFASTPLAQCLQHATPDQIRSETEISTPNVVDIPKKIKTSSKLKKHPLPSGFGISDRVKEWALKKEFTQLEDHLEAFQSSVRKHGYQYVDWDEAFMEAIRKDWAKLNEKKAPTPASRKLFVAKKRQLPIASNPPKGFSDILEKLSLPL